MHHFTLIVAPYRQKTLLVAFRYYNRRLGLCGPKWLVDALVKST